MFLHANKMYWHHMSSLYSGACELLKSAYDLGQPGHVYKQVKRVVVSFLDDEQQEEIMMVVVVVVVVVVLLLIM